MNRKTKLIAGGVTAVALIGGGTAIAMASGVGDDDEPLTGTTLDQAVAAALAETGGGRLPRPRSAMTGRLQRRGPARGRQSGRGRPRRELQGDRPGSRRRRRQRSGRDDDD